MSVLWDSGTSLTAAEIVGISDNRTWKENSIYIIMNSLLKKGAVTMVCHKPTGTNIARAYMPTITADEYAASSIKSMMESGVNIDIRALIGRLTDKKDG